jgi:hypothetical protein
MVGWLGGRLYPQIIINQALGLMPYVILRSRLFYLMKDGFPIGGEMPVTINFEAISSNFLEAMRPR